MNNEELDKELAAMVAEDKAMKTRIADAKAMAWIAAVPAFLLAGCIVLSSTLIHDDRIIGCALIALILSVGNGFTTGKLRGW